MKFYDGYLRHVGYERSVEKLSHHGPDLAALSDSLRCEIIAIRKNEGRCFGISEDHEMARLTV